MTVPRPESPPASAPTTLLAAALLLGTQAVAAMAGGVWIEVGTLRQHPRGLELALSSGLFLLICGGALAVVAVCLARGRRWTRGPTVAAELLALLMGYDVLSASSVLPEVSTAVGWVVVVVSLVTLVLMFLPPSTVVFRDRSG